jgi:hypothetical protein
MSIWSTTKTALTGLGFPLAASAMILATGADLPDEYLVYQMISNPPEMRADNLETLRSYRVQVSVYSRTGLAVIPAQVETAMLAAGFTRLEGRELPYNSQTRHFGCALDYNYLEEV